MFLLFQLLNLIIGILGYAYAPNHYSRELCILATILYILSFAGLVTNKKEKNYFTFEIIFSITYFFVFYMYPIIAKPLGVYNFLYSYNEEIVTKATFLATVGYSAFVIGNASTSLIKHRFRVVVVKRKENNYYNQTGKLTLPIALCVVVLVLTFLQFFVFHANRYETMETGATINGIWSYINIIEHAIVMSSITLGFYGLYRDGNYKLEKENRVLWILIGLSVLASFVAGYRGIPMGYVIAIIAGWVIYKGGMSAIRLFILVVFGLILMNYILVMRDNGSLQFSFDVISLASDLMTNNYTLYKGYDYVQNHGLVLFPLVGPLITAVPFLLSRIMAIFEIPSHFASTASFLTYETIGNLRLGMGSNVIISIYLSLGFLGVLTLMYLLGKYVRYVSYNVKEAGMTRLLLYFEIMAIAVYMVRADLFYSVSHIVWGIVFLKLFQKVSFRKQLIR